MVTATVEAWSFASNSFLPGVEGRKANVVRQAPLFYRETTAAALFNTLSQFFKQGVVRNNFYTIIQKSPQLS